MKSISPTNGQALMRRAKDYDWAWVVEEAAGAIVGAIAKEAFLAVFGEALGSRPDYVSMFNNAINEIETRVGALIEAEFIGEWAADADSVRSSLLGYMETNNISPLENRIEGQASDLTRRFKSLEDYRGFSGFMICASLHLACIKYLSFENEAYKTTLNRLIEEYSNWAEQANEWTLERAETNVSSSCHTVSRFDPSGRPGRLDRVVDPGDRQGRSDPMVFLDTLNHSRYSFNWGNDHSKEWTSSDSTGEGICENTRRDHYNEVVEPARDRYEQMKNAIENWRN